MLCDKIQHFGVGSHGKYSTWLCLVLYVTWLHLSYCILLHNTYNGALTSINKNVEKSGVFTKCWKLFWKHVCVVFQNKEYLNTIKRYPGRSFIKFERNESSFEISFCVRSIRIFTKFPDDPYYEPPAWLTIILRRFTSKYYFTYCGSLHFF